jgi:hypothetical protein
MEIHKPKPFRNLREFLSEVSVVVVGIVIALAAESAIQGFEWRHRTRLADEQMHLEIAGDDGPQVYERIALSPCVNGGLNDIFNAVQQNAARVTLIDVLGRFWTPRHTWDSTAFQAAAAGGVLARMPAERVDEVSRFYTLMPVLDGANEREFRDGAALFLNPAGGALTDAEKDRILGAVETIRRDNEEIVRLVTLAAASMNELAIRVSEYRMPKERTSPLQVPERVVTEAQNHPMAQHCVAELKKSVSQQ